MVHPYAIANCAVMSLVLYRNSAIPYWLDMSYIDCSQSQSQAEREEEEATAAFIEEAISVSTGVVEMVFVSSGCNKMKYSCGFRLLCLW